MLISELIINNYIYIYYLNIIIISKYIYIYIFINEKLSKSEIWLNFVKIIFILYCLFIIEYEVIINSNICYF